jgi:hypothetical protein
MTNWAHNAIALTHAILSRVADSPIETTRAHQDAGDHAGKHFQWCDANRKGISDHAALPNCDD